VWEEAVEKTVDITVYLPDETGKAAKAADLNFSRLLRDAVLEELRRLDELADARGGMTEQTIDLEDRNGDPLRLRFEGKAVAGTDPDVYLTTNGTVVVVFEDEYETFDDVEAFSDWVSDWQHRNNHGQSREAVLQDAVAQLGGRRVVDIS
jgi:post-segregation antitoxin (ccd killing protein)